MKESSSCWFSILNVLPTYFDARYFCVGIGRSIQPISSLWNGLFLNFNCVLIEDECLRALQHIKPVFENSMLDMPTPFVPIVRPSLKSKVIVFYR